MDVYLLDSVFSPVEVIDEFESGVWTERFTEAGDFKLVLPASTKNVNRFNLGSFLRSSVSRDVMRIETQEIDAGSMTLSGRSMEVILENHSLPPDFVYTETTYPADHIYRLALAIKTSVEGLYNFANVGKLKFGDTGGMSGTQYKEALNGGGVSFYSQILELAKKYNVGLRVFPETAAGANGLFESKDFLFSTYVGVDRTGLDPSSPIIPVIFSPALDNFRDIKDLRSVANTLDQVWVYPPKDLRVSFETKYPNEGGVIRMHRDSSQVHHNDFILVTDRVGWRTRRRSIVAEEIKANMIGARGGGQPTLAQLMRQVGARELAKNKKTHVVDGDVIPTENFKYRRDYQLGDLVQLAPDAFNGTAVAAMLSEYIFSDDGSGEYEYPTVVVPQDPPQADGAEASTYD